MRSQRAWLRSAPLLVALLGPVPVVALGADVVINEIDADGSSLKDEDGELSDWIELHNRSDEAVELRGWALTDNLRKALKWTFPDVTLDADGYLVVFASGKNRKRPGAPLHTSFKLDRSGEYLALIQARPAGRVASELAPRYPPQRSGYSYGLIEGDTAVCFLSPPTPGAANRSAAAACRPALPEVDIEPPRGFYGQAVTVVLTSPVRAAEIYYSLDGSEPGRRPEQLYAGPFTVVRPTVVRARAFAPEQLPSPIATSTFLIGLTGAELRLPVLSLATDPANLTGRYGIVGISDLDRKSAPGVDLYPGWGDYPAKPGAYFNPVERGRDWERPVSVELLHPDGRKGFQLDAGVRVSGSSWTRSHTHLNTKFSYRLYFRGEYGPAELDYPLIPGAGTSRFKHLVLRAGLDDHANPFIRDELTRRSWADMGHASALGTFVHLFINGEFKGYYNPTEYIDSATLNRWNGTRAQWDIIKQRGEVLEGDGTAWRQLMARAPLGFPPRSDQIGAISRAIDLPGFCDYVLLNLYAGTWDWPDNNWVAARPLPDGKFSFLTWDAEGAFGLKGDLGFDVIVEEFQYMRDTPSDLPQLFRALLESQGMLRLVPEDARWSYAKGDSASTEPAQAWLAPGYDDSTWAVGQTPIGYGENDERTLLDDMRGRYASVAMRQSFELDRPERLGQLILSVRYDDAFVAYLNGHEVARSEGLRGIRGLPHRAQRSRASHEASGRHYVFDVSEHRAALVPGKNVLCIQGHNVDLDSSDFSVDAVLTGYDFDHQHPFRALFRERVKRHMFGDGALTQRRLRARYEQLAANLAEVIPDFDELPGKSIGDDWLPGRRGLFLEQLRRHGLWWPED